jgi:hypothetical protein
MRTPSPRRLIVFGAPAAVAAVTLLHPVVRDAPSRDLDGRVTLWLTVHLLQLPLFGLLAAAMWLLVAGLPGRAAQVSRLAVLPFAVFYAAFDALVGIATGLMLRHAAELPGAAATADGLWAERLRDPWVGAVVLPAVLGWVVAGAAAAVALARAGAPRAAVVALVLATALFGVDHAPPFGPLAMVALLAAVVLLERHAAAVAASADPGPPPADARRAGWRPRSGSSAS